MSSGLVSDGLVSAGLVSDGVLAWAARTPERAAIIFGAEAITYT